MNTIVGTYECKVDAKGRVLLPAPLKKQLALSLQDGFVLKRSVFQPCLELYPMDEWNLMMQKINKLNRFVKKNNDFIRRFTAGVKVTIAFSVLSFVIDLTQISDITARWQSQRFTHDNSKQELPTFCTIRLAS